ncbi:MAG TPA: DUF429 domain-containing protein [Burkholderiales bacterium]|nr:DUF429 domain-containing protein [Burkholderiales bacterium]
MRIYGVDFTSAPRPAKPITVAHATLHGPALRVEKIERLSDFDSFEAFLRRPGPWIGGFDFPFGLPREAVVALGLPTEWRAMTQECRRRGKAEFRRRLDELRESRMEGNRYAKRAGDSASGAHPAVKLVNPPVGLMFFEGSPRLAEAGLTVPRLALGDPARIALEAYPGMLIRKHLNILEPYKNDQKSRQSPEHRKARRKIVRAIKHGLPLDIRVKFGPSIEAAMIDDGSGDNLDAVLCAIQADWGCRQGAPAYGLPAGVDPVEGWIVSA